MSRKDLIATEITRIAADLSGYEPDELAWDKTFLQLGFDSLFLTQLATMISNRFETQVTFRSLFSEHPSITELAGHLDGAMPAALRHDFEAAPSQAAEPDVSAEPEPVVDAGSPAVASSAADATDLNVDGTGAGAGGTPLAGVPSSGLAALLTEQLTLMERQLELLGGTRATGARSSTRVDASASPAATPARTAKAAPEAAQPPASGGGSDSAPVSVPVAEAPEDAPIELPPGFGPGTTQGGAADIGEAQRAHLQALEASYTERTAGSKDSAQRHRQWHADPRTASGFNPLWKEMVYPIVVNRSQGSRLWDIDGNEYIDLLNGFGPNFLGHSPDFITDALIDQLRSGVEIGPQTPLAGETARMICEFSGMDRATFVNTGSEAVQAAMRVARTVTGRDGIVVFSGDYHGNFDEVLVRAVGKPDHPRTVPMAPGIPRSSVSEVRVLPYGEDRALELIEEDAGQLAAVVVEPIQSRRPELQPREFLHRLRALTEAHGILLIFDEVITGFRCQPGGAQAFYGVDADLVTFGKIVGGGMPIGVVAGRARYMDTFDGGFWRYGDDSFPEAGVTFFAGTFIRHPLTIKATHETVKYLLAQGPEVYARVNASAEWLCTRLNALFERHGIDIEVPHCNSQVFVRVNEKHPLAGLLFFHLRLRGIYIQEGFPCYLTDAHSQEDLEQVLAAFEASVAAMVDAGIFDSSVAADAAVPLDAEPTEAFPLTPSQLEIWLDAVAMAEATCAYNESDTLRLIGALDEERLRRCLDRVVESHAAFRLRFAEQSQFLDAESGFETTFIDLSDVEGDPDACLEDLRRSMGRTAFDLEAGPVCRAVLVRTQPEEHYLIFGAHHLVFDGWSAEVLLHQLAALYAQEGAPSPPAVPGFHTVVERLASPEVQAVQERSTQYWVDRLRDSEPETLELPTDHPRPATWDFAGATRSCLIDPALVQRLRAAASGRGVTMYALTLAAFRALLARLTGNRSFAIGTSVSGQPLLELPQVIGNCINFIPVPAKVDPDMALADFLGQSMDDVFSISEHPLTTLGQLVQQVKCRRDLSRPVLAQVVFNYAPDSARIRFPGLEVSREENPRSYVHFDLFANLTETEGGLALDWDYPTALFDADTIGGWMACFERLLESMADALENDAAARPIGELEWVPEAQRHWLLQECNETDRDLPAVTILEMIAAHAATRPEAPAVRFGPCSLSYGELDRAANALAKRIIDHLGDTGGASPDPQGDPQVVPPDVQPIIGLAMNRSERLVVAMLAVWKAGCAYLPLDPGFPRSRLTFMAGDSDAALLLLDEDHQRPLDFAGPVIAVSDLEPGGAARAPEPIGSGELAYLIYTSGSTGQPKGVCVGHDPLRNLLHSMARAPGLDADDMLLAVTTLSFDISVLELLLPLTVGATVQLAAQEDITDGAALGALIERSGATVLQATPSTWRLLLDAGWSGKAELKALCGGEPLPEDLAKALEPRVGSLWNMYGPTETTVWSTCEHIVAEDDRITVGRPIDNTQVYVLDDTGRPVARGVIGELFIGGAGVARGYHEREALTRDRFLANPFREGPDERMYRTGDLGRFLADGRIEHLGRVDSQVKVRGFRIELGEIEACLNDQPGVEQAVAQVFEPVPGDQRLVAYLVTAGDQRPATIALRKAMRQRLPDYMIPQHFEQIDSVPLTPNGKLDRNALVCPEVFGASSRVGAPPSSEMERSIAAVWAELLGISGLTTADNFFELGGHSLLAMRAIQRMAEALGHRLPPQVLVINSLGEVAELMEEHLPSKAERQNGRQNERQNECQDGRQDERKGA